MKETENLEARQSVQLPTIPLSLSKCASIIHIYFLPQCMIMYFDLVLFFVFGCYPAVGHMLQQRYFYIAACRKSPMIPFYLFFKVFIVKKKK